jgi:nitrogen fixation/metabolism regulation signal transduction histidine kinase
MATDPALGHEELLAALDAPDWTVALQAVVAAESHVQGAVLGERELEEIVGRLAALANHTKWEVRRAVANAAAQTPHAAFETVLARLALDDNTRVRQAAAHAALRRRDSRHASMLGKQHEQRINSTLDDIEARFGARGREAVKRAAEQIANTFARELYHEVIKLVSPLAASADRLRVQLSTNDVQREALAEEAERIGRRVAQVRAVLDAMRVYTAQPVLTFKTEVLRELVLEAANVALESDTATSPRPVIEVNVASDTTADVVRPRLVQALTNVLLNAIESYQGVDVREPIKVGADLQDGLLAITVQDAGCGMSAEVQKDALTLFATSKPNGTGFGLPLAVKIVESEHGGRLSVESVRGRGTLIRMIVPKHRHGDRS